jgi:hypothetical protein
MQDFEKRTILTIYKEENRIIKTEAIHPSKSSPGMSFFYWLCPYFDSEINTQ